MFHELHRHAVMGSTASARDGAAWGASVLCGGSVMYLNKTERDHCIRITISLRPPENGDSGYVGAQSSHPPAPGEDWRRGRDLSDGPATSETLAKIVRDIEAIMAGFANSSDMDGPC